jgi:hypothetical protein
MRYKTIQRGGTLLGLFVLLTLIWNRRSGNLLAGAVYLIAATFVSSISVSPATIVQSKERKGTTEPVDWSSQREAHALFLFAWELAIIGWLNVEAFAFSGATSEVVFGYSLVVLFVVLLYKMLGLAESSEQDGGSRPLSYFGRPRSRRLLFFVLIYTPITPLIMASAIWSGRGWCPVLLQPPQIWLLLIVSLSAASAGMVFHRYREVPPNKALAIRLFVPSTCGLLGLAALQAIFRFNVYVYILSSITVVGIAATVYWLSLARGASLATS